MVSIMSEDSTSNVMAFPIRVFAEGCFLIPIPLWLEGEKGPLLLFKFLCYFSVRLQICSHQSVLQIAVFQLFPIYPLEVLTDHAGMLTILDLHFQSFEIIWVNRSLSIPIPSFPFSQNFDSYREYKFNNLYGHIA